MDIPNWLIVFAIVAIIVAAFVRSTGEFRLEQISGPMDAGDEGPYSAAAAEAQPRGTMSEDQQELKELLDARTNLQDQLCVLQTGRSLGGGPAADRLRATLKEIDEQIAELRSEPA
jgi:hypothetical protein